MCEKQQEEACKVIQIKAKVECKIGSLDVIVDYSVIQMYVYVGMIYRNYPFFVLEIFSDGTRYLKICYTNIILVWRIFSIESFVT